MTQDTALTKRQGFQAYVSRVVNDRCDTFLARPEQRERLSRIVMGLVPKNPRILDCTPQSVAMALLYCAELGLEPSSTTGHAWLIPRWSKQAGAHELTFIVGYKGFLELAHRVGNVKTIYAGVVYQGEDFSVLVDGEGVSISHSPNLAADFDRSDDALIASYAIVRTKDGGVYADWCSRSEIDKRRNAGGGRKFSPWSTYFPRMARKSAIRKLFSGGAVPMAGSAAHDLRKAIELDLEAELKASQDRPKPVAPPLAILEGEADPIAGLFEDGEE